MKRLVVGVVASLSVCGAASGASAGVYSDDLGRCLVRHASDHDRAMLVQWVFSAMAANPSVRSIVAITPEQHTQFDKGMAQVVSRLIYKDCRAETVDAIKNEGIGAIEASFKMLGEASMQSLLNDKDVVASISSYTKYVDIKEMENVIREAGITPAAPQTK